LLRHADYVDENGNLLEDFVLPAPTGNGKPASTGGDSSGSKTAAPKLPSMDTLAYSQQQQQLEIWPLAVDAGRMQQQYSYGGQQAAAAAAADCSWEHHQMLVQQQQQQQARQQQMWHEQQQQQNLQQGKLLKSLTWQEHLLLQQSQQAQAEQQAAAAGGCFPHQLLKSKSLPPSTAVVSGMTGSAAAPNTAVANQAALILAQRSSGQQIAAADGCNAQELPNPAAAGGAAATASQPGSSMFAGSSLPAAAAATAAGSLWQGGVTVTTSVGFASSSPGTGSFAGMVQDMQQQQHQQQMSLPELTVAELDLPPMAPLMPSSSMAQQQQVLSMPSYGMPPNQQQYQLGATWQQQQQLQPNGCSGMLNSCGSSASAAMQFAQQSSALQLQMPANANAGAGPGVGLAQTGSSSGGLFQLGSAGNAHASSMSAPMQPAGASHHPMQLSMNSSRFSPLHGQQLARQQSQSSGMGPHAPAVTHALSARMASCELGEAIKLARQAAAAQGVTDLTGALRQMSSTQLPVITTASGSNLQLPQQQQQQQQNAAAGGVVSGTGLLQYQGSGMSVSVSSMSAGTSSGGLGPTVGLQLPVQSMARHAIAEQGPAAAAAVPAGSGGTPKHALAQEGEFGVAPGCAAAAAAPASKRARTSSLHDDGPVPSCK
jgi:hypothetical protein